MTSDTTAIQQDKNQKSLELADDLELLLSFVDWPLPRKAFSSSPSEERRS